MTLEAVLFDIDGVLLDSREANRSFLMDVLSSAGYPVPTGPQCDRVFHRTLYDALRELSGEHDEAVLRRLWEAALRRRYPHEKVRVPHGARAAIGILHGRLRLGIVTSRVRIGIEGFFDIFGSRECFEVAVGYEDYSRPKPDPEPLRVAMRMLGVKSGDTAYVGDAPNDLEAGRRAGVRVVLYGPHASTDADVRVTTFHELVKILEGWGPGR